MKNKLYLYNTATKKKELFSTENSEVGLYCCGPTVYNFAHIGNLRTYIFEDVLKRVLTSSGYKVKHVVNITDVGHLTSDADTGEDRMEKGARREGKSVWDIAEYYTSFFMKDIHDLNILDADLWPRATDHIKEMIDLIQKLVDNGATYRTSDGIYFDTTKFPAYCDFARLDPDALKAGSRIDMGEKKNPTDFALWKFSPKDTKRMMEWNSPWGVGFPGWHIECSAMALKYLSQPVDIHCGGIDHIRIHHTNEIAQVEAAMKKKFVRFWLHGEFLVLDKEKMSKSKDNFFTIDFLKENAVPPLAYRFFCFSAHYRSPLSFSMDNLQNAAQSLRSLKRCALNETAEVDDKTETITNGKILDNFKDAILDDLNMPRAVAAVWDVLHSKVYSADEKTQAILFADKILGLDLLTAEPEKIVLNSEKSKDLNIRIISDTPCAEDLQNSIYALIAERKSAREQKNYDKADKLREELQNMGVAIKDLSDGITECIIKK
ncbi:MAG: cysteine--tRNA ligase [Chitinispirillia bacterium]|jgi:cysteinyl-tRNA synthetase